MNKKIADIYDSLQELAWYFGSNGINEECCADLSFAEFMALKKIYQVEDCSIKAIANALNFTKSGATRIINRLENKGHVIRKNSPIDGRICCVSITSKGMKAISKSMENFTLYLQDIFKEIELQDIEYVGYALKIVVDLIKKNKLFNKSVDTDKKGECC